MPQAVHIDGLDKPVYFPDGMKPEDIERAIETDVLPQLQTQQASTPATVQAAAPAPTLGESLKRGVSDQIEGWEQKFLQLNDRLNNRANRRAAENPNPAITPSPESHSADNYTQQANAGRQNYVERRGHDAGFDWARLGGNVAGSAPLMLLPGGAAGALARAGAGAITGAVQGATQFDPTNSIKGELTNTAVGAGTGAVINPIAGAISDKLKSAYQWIAGRIAGANAETLGATTQAAIDKAVPEVTQLPTEARQAIYDEAIQQVRTTGTLNAEELARKANLIANGVTPTKSMVTRSPRDWTMERNLQKMAQSPDPKLQQIGEELTGVYQTNDRALSNQLVKQAEGLPKGTQEQFGERAMAGLDRVSRDSQKAVGKEYDAIHGEDIINPTPNALHEKLYSADIQDIEDPAVKTVVKTVENRLKRLGIVKSDPSVGIDGGQTYELTGKALNAKQTEELRKLLNGLDTPSGTNAGRVKAQIIKSLDESITREGGMDVYAHARSAASSRFGMLDNPATQRALNTYGELQQGKTAQQFIQQQIVGAADQDVAAILKTLETDPAAIDSIRAGVLQHLESKSVNVNSGQFSGAALNKELDRLGESKLQMIFGPQGSARLKSLARAGLDATYQPAYAAVNNSNTAPMLLSAIEKSRMVPGVPLIVTDEVKSAAQSSNAKKQLTDALAARASSLPVPVNPRIQGLIDALRASLAPTSVAVTNQFRNKNNQRAGDK
jgi:hypothetical protein